MTKMMQQVLAGMSSNMKPMLMSSLPAGEYREKLADLFLQKFQSKLRVEQLMDLAIPIYAKYFSKEELEGLMRFTRHLWARRLCRFYRKPWSKCRRNR